jgi:hypothetical protein
MKWPFDMVLFQMLPEAAGNTITCLRYSGESDDSIVLERRDKLRRDQGRARTQLFREAPRRHSYRLPGGRR